MILKQFYLGCLAHASYLIADEESGVAAVVDPQRDVDEYIEYARRIGCRIGHSKSSACSANVISIGARRSPCSSPASRGCGSVSSNPTSKRSGNV